MCAQQLHHSQLITTFSSLFSLQVAFHGFKSFPNRSTLKSRHEHHFAKIKTEWNKREKERESQTLNTRESFKQVGVCCTLCHMTGHMTGHMTVT